MKKEERISKIKEEMRSIYVNTLTGKSSLFDLCEKIGVKERVRYFNFIERKAPKKEWSIDKPFVVKKITFDYGFRFNDGFEIRHVSRRIANVYDAPIVEVRERLIK